MEFDPTKSRETVYPENETNSQKAFYDHVKNYVNYEGNISVEEQLAFMDTFWSNIGMDMPAIPAASANLARDRIVAYQSRYNQITGVEANTLRVVPAPMLNLKERSTMLYQAHVTMDIARRRHKTALDVPSGGPDNKPFVELLKDPTSFQVYEDKYASSDQHKFFGIRYQDGEKTYSLREYVDHMVQSNKAVIGADGRVWILSLVDLKTFHNLDGNATVESLLAAQAMHLTRFNSDKQESVDLLSEAEKKSDERGLNDAPSANYMRTASNEFVFQQTGTLGPVGVTRVGGYICRHPRAGEVVKKARSVWVGPSRDNVVPRGYVGWRKRLNTDINPYGRVGVMRAQDAHYRVYMDVLNFEPFTHQMRYRTKHNVKPYHIGTNSRFLDQYIEKPF